MNVIELQREVLQEDTKGKDIAEIQPDKWETDQERMETTERQDGARSAPMRPSLVQLEPYSRLSHNRDDSAVSADSEPGE